MESQGSWPEDQARTTVVSLPGEISYYTAPQVHDELLFEVPLAETDEVAALVRTEMEGVVKLKVPLVADLASGPNWRDMD